MSIRLMLKLELGRTNSQQRSIFWTEMRKRGWLPYLGKPNVLCTEIRGTHEDCEILSFAEGELQFAASAAQIKKWNCVCILEDIDVQPEELHRAV